jgi:hypothetical protein
MRAPEREQLVVLYQALGQLKLFVAGLEMGDDFKDRARAFAVKPTPLVFRERIIVAGRVQSATA